MNPTLLELKHNEEAQLEIAKIEDTIYQKMTRGENDNKRQMVPDSNSKSLDGI